MGKWSIKTLLNKKIKKKRLRSTVFENSSEEKVTIMNDDYETNQDVLMEYGKL